MGSARLLKKDVACPKFRKSETKFKEEIIIAYLICNIKKIPKEGVPKVERENERDENYLADNPQIDSSRTHNNYHTFQREGTWMEYCNKRIKELNLPTAVRHDAIYIGSTVIGASPSWHKETSQEKQKQFFEDCTRFFIDKYGEENIVSAVVHLDETTPHMHLNFMPITRDGRLSAKRVICPKELSDLQTEFHIAVGVDYGLERGKEGSQRKHLSTTEYKAKKIIEEAQEAKEMITGQINTKLQEYDEVRKERDKIVAARDKEADYSKLLQDAKDGIITKDKRKLKDQIAALTVENGKLQKENDILKSDNADLFKLVKKNENIAEDHKKALSVIKVFRDKEPVAFARTFYRVGGLLESFIPKGERPALLPRSRLAEIEEEIAEEKRQKQLNKPSGNKSNWHK